MKKTLAVTIAALAAMAANVCAAQQPSVVVNDKAIDTPAIIQNDRVLVPLRGVYEELGFEISWDAESKTAEFIKGDQRMSISADSEIIEINGQSIVSDVPASITDGRFYLPLRAAAEGFALNVNWDAESKTASISGEVGKEEESSVTDDSSSFAYELNRMMPKDTNYMFSPFSIKMALSLAANGAGGETKDQITKTLGIGSLDNYNSYARQLIDEYSKNKNVELSIANSLWLNADKAGDITFNGDYLDAMEKTYDAKLDTVNMSNAVEKVNSWCSKSTKGKIPSIIDSPDFFAILANAIYFKGDWALPFNEELTDKRTFTDRNGKATEIDFMNNTDDYRYYEHGDTKIVEMPYKGGDTVMYLVLNGDKRISLDNYFNKLSYEKVHISMPKFKIEYSVKLNDMLKNAGITTAFTDAADFNKMFDGGPGFRIEKVLHKTYIDVDETGTEAAAVTAIVMETTAVADPDPVIIKEFVADKPFTYVIAQKDTNEILFMGEYAFAE